MSGIQESFQNKNSDKGGAGAAHSSTSWGAAGSTIGQTTTSNFDSYSRRAGARRYYSDGSIGPTSMMDDGGIQRLYEVVDDKEAYLNYDHYMNKNCVTKSEEIIQDYLEGGSSIKKQRVVVALSEEDLVDRMLSQFPEFGTNRPSPFTVEDEDLIDHYSTAAAATSPASVVTDKDGMGDTNNNNNNNNATNITVAAAAAGGEDDSSVMISPNSRFFTDDASDMIGKLFFGSAATTGASTSQSPAAAARHSTPPTSMMNSTSEAAAVMQSVKNKRGIVDGGSRLTPTVGQKAAVSTAYQQELMGDSATVTTAAVAGVSRNENYSSVWDQDEIDLWSNTTIVPPPPPSSNGTKASLRDNQPCASRTLSYVAIVALMEYIR